MARSRDQPASYDPVAMEHEMLAGLGYQVVGETSVTAALRRFRDEPRHFDLIITDQTMARMTGIEFAAQLLTLRSVMPILLLCSGFSETVAPEKAKSMGIRELITKPATRRELAETSRRLSSVDIRTMNSGWQEH